MGVSENNGFPPKSSHFFGGLFHDFHHPFWGFSPYFWKHLPYHHIIKLPILKPPHGATTKVATSAWTTNHHCIAPPFFFGAFTDPERMDIGPIWMFHLTSQMRWKRMWWKTWGIFVRKKNTGFLLILGFRIHWSAFFGGKFHQKKCKIQISKGHENSAVTYNTFCKDNLEIGSHPLKRREFMLVNLNGFLANWSRQKKQAIRPNSSHLVGKPFQRGKPKLFLR